MSEQKKIIKQNFNENEIVQCMKTDKALKGALTKEKVSIAFYGCVLGGKYNPNEKIPEKGLFVEISKKK